MNSADTTVVVLACNRDRFLAEALGSVRAQTYPGWELLLSDASTDPHMRASSEDAFELHTRLSGSNLSRFIRSKPGLAQAEHLGAVFSEVRTPYIALLDDDDVWMPGHLNEALAWLRGDARRGVSVANSVVIDEYDHITGVRERPVRPLPSEANIPACLDYMLRYAFSSTSGIVVRRSSISGHRFYVTSCVDVHLCVSALLAGSRVGLSMEPTFYYRVHAASSYAKGYQAHADRHRLRLHLATKNGWRLTRRVPLYPLLVLKSALCVAGFSLVLKERRLRHLTGQPGRPTAEHTANAR